MSYDLGVWRALRPITTQEAADIYGRLCEEDMAAVEPHPGVDSFLAELTARYPQIDDWDDGDIDNCPWSVAFDQSDRHILMSMSFSRVDEIVPFIEELAAKYDLVCFNPQWPCVVYPPRVAAMPHLRLSLENWTVIDNPTPDQIADALSSLDADGNSFAILEQTDTTYIQAGLQSTGEYVIEYQDGSLDKHYQSITRNSQQLMAMFRAYAEGHDTWKQQCEWNKIDLQPETPHNLVDLDSHTGLQFEEIAERITGAA